MRWVKWSERAPTVADTDQTRYVITKRLHAGEILFQCVPYNGTDAVSGYWLEGARDALCESLATAAQSVSHIRKVEL